MIYPSIDKILNEVDSKYALVYIVANQKSLRRRRDYAGIQKNQHHQRRSRPAC